MFDEPTITEEEREALLRERAVAAEAKLVRATLPVTSVLVIARGPNVPTGALVRDDDTACACELDPILLAEILAAADDDVACAAAVRLVLDPNAGIEHWVGRASDGRVESVVAVAIGSRVERRWLRAVLARAADSVAAWLAAAPPSPMVALLAATTEPTVVHEGGLVILANPAAARLFGRDADELVGVPVARLTRGFPIVRACWLPVGNHPRDALVLAASRPAGTECSLTAIVDAVVARHYPLVRNIAQLSIDRGEDGMVGASPARVDELVELALLDATAILTDWSRRNRIHISVACDGQHAVLEISVTGVLGARTDPEHFGVATCAARTRSIGGAFTIDTSDPERRVVKIALPVAS